MPSLVVFDLDGTLIDSRRDLADSVNALIVEQGGRPLAIEVVAAMVGEGAKLLVSRALAAAQVELELDTAVARFLQLYDARLLAHTTLYPGIAAVLADVGKRARLAVLTNKPQRPTVQILEGLGIAGHFDAVVGGDTLLGRKPDPAGLRHLMATLQAAPRETVLAGDSLIDIRTARAAGTRLCLVRYGFGFPSSDAEWPPDTRIADSPSDIPGAIRQLV